MEEEKEEFIIRSNLVDSEIQKENNEDKRKEMIKLVQRKSINRNENDLNQ